ncbi:50S ribosomal protein L10 [Candidatus Saccharibacteria bacterium]|nr:50S ribosomal protein L10 [Candidatus Saccharibacteria bacterium]
MSTNKQEKKQQVDELTNEISASQAVVFSDYSGLTVGEIGDLRKRLSDLGARFKVVKNTLLNIALEKSGLKDGKLAGPTAILTTGDADPFESIKMLVSTFKERDKGEVKFGFFENAFVDSVKIAELAAIPGREVLQARVVSQLSAPISNLAYLLNGTSQRLVVALDQIAKGKGGVSDG